MQDGQGLAHQQETRLLAEDGGTLPHLWMLWQWGPASNESVNQVRRKTVCYTTFIRPHSSSNMLLVHCLAPTLNHDMFTASRFWWLDTRLWLKSREPQSLCQAMAWGLMLLGNALFSGNKHASFRVEFCSCMCSTSSKSEMWTMLNWGQNMVVRAVSWHKEMKRHTKLRWWARRCADSRHLSKTPFMLRRESPTAAAWGSNTTGWVPVPVT